MEAESGQNSMFDPLRGWPGSIEDYPFYVENSVCRCGSFVDEVQAERYRERCAHREYKGLIAGCFGCRVLRRTKCSLEKNPGEISMPFYRHDRIYEPGKVTVKGDIRVRIIQI